MLQVMQPDNQPGRNRWSPDRTVDTTERVIEGLPIESAASRTSGWRMLMIESSRSRNRSSWWLEEGFERIRKHRF